MFDSTIDSFHQADDVGNGAATVADLATFFDRYEQPEVAATLYGSTTGYTSIVMVANPPATIEQLRTVLGEPRFAECVAAGEAMESPKPSSRHAARSSTPASDSTTNPDNGRLARTGD
jgi:hypothetical protein